MTFDTAFERSTLEPCRWCVEGDAPKFLDRDGTLVSITGNEGVLSHAHEEYWWPCLKFGVEIRCARVSANTVPTVDEAAIKCNDSNMEAWRKMFDRVTSTVPYSDEQPLRGVVKDANTVIKLLYKEVLSLRAAASTVAPQQSEPQYLTINGQRRMVIPCPDGKPDCEVLHTAPAIQDETDDLVDEVQHRMDQVVEAAVEWHQAGREGVEWFEAAEKLGAAIDSLLELRDDPKGRVSECFCGTELEAGLCPNGHDSATPSNTQASPALTDLQQAYDQGVEDAKCAIRAESQGGGYWAAAYINAIARRCSPFRYTGMPRDADEATREQIVQAITDIQEARESHVQWANHLRNEKHGPCEGCDNFAAHIGNADYHDEWIVRYDNVIAALARVPFSASDSSSLARKAAGEIFTTVQFFNRLDDLAEMRDANRKYVESQITAIIERCLSEGEA